MSHLFLVDSAIHVLVAIAAITNSLRTQSRNESFVDRGPADRHQRLTGWIVMAGALADIATVVSGAGSGSVAC